MSSRCARFSSIAPRARRTGPRQSGMFATGDPAYGLDERFPSFTLGREHCAAVGGNAIESAAPAVLFDPSSGDPSTPFQPVQQWIHGRSFEAQRPLRPALDELTQVVSVTRPAFHQREDQQLGASFLQL